VRAFVTGATGFIGVALVRALLARGDDVTALVRDPARAGSLEQVGCELVEGDVTRVAGRAFRGCDAVFHCAAIYRVGVRGADAAEVRRVNVTGTERVLDGALAARVPRIVHVSTVNAFGDTGGRVVDEAYRRPAGKFVSAYDETKWLAHEAAHTRMAGGAPIRVAMPGVTYGPGDRSQIGGQVHAAMTGRLRYVSFPTLGLNAAHVDDVAAGLLLVHDRGVDGQDYVLGGELTTMRRLISAAAAAAGRTAPRLTMPTTLVRLTAPLASTLGRFVGLPPNVPELVRASDGVTYWASDAKARRELGYAPRDLERGLADTAAALLSAA
jgi:dihydroflavonol-4-reductase